MNTHAITAPSIEPALFTVAEAAQLLRLGESTAWQAISAGKIKVVKFGRRTFVARDEVQRLASTGF